MKAYSITFQTIVNAFKHQWKCILVSVLIFALLGAAGGWLFAGRGSSEPGGGGAQALPVVDFQKVAYTQTYYSDCLQALADSYKLLDNYFSKAFNESGSLPELLERQTALNAEKQEFQQTVLAPLQYTIQKADAIYAPEEFLDDLARQYESQLATVRINLIASEASTETIRQMSAPNYENEDVTKNYQNLISQAAQYGTLLKNQAVYETILDQLQNKPERVRADSRRVQRELESAAQALNTLLKKASQTAEEIGVAANVYIRLQPSGKSYDVLIDHTYRAASVTESFAVIEVFCVLVGICTGAFFAVYQEAKEEACRSSFQPHGPETSA